MTTITIERAFLIKVLNQIDIAQSLLERSQHRAKMAAVYEELRAALAAPATAPAQPEIVDLLAEMYELILANKVVLAEKSGGVWTWPDRAIEAVRKHRSGPAQPAWHVAPTVPGNWISDDFEGISTFNSDDTQAFKTNTGVRWYGPIPPDGDKP